jgi:tRNA(adenine34) deaminase
MPTASASTLSQDTAFMQLALQLATEAAAAGEVPVGAVLVKDGVVIGTGRNSPIASTDPTAHAEMLALRAAALAMGNYRLDDCTLYVTLEPCAMCSGAVLHGRLQRLVFAAADPKTGCAGSVTNLFDLPLLNHQTQVERGLLAEPSAALLREFFQRKRVTQRETACPLREDALRTPQHRFEQLSEYPWAPAYTNAIPALAGLRMHYLDLGADQGAGVYLCLHPIPGWSHSYRLQVPDWLGQGVRVLLPDLIGFGKSDKPKRELAHSLDFHCRYLLEWLDALALHDLTLVLPYAWHPVAQQLLVQAPQRFNALLVVPPAPCDSNDSDDAAQNAPYPDAGHRAAERAFSAWRTHSTKIPP